jgi:site-specific DNA-cytosine methylase
MLGNGWTVDVVVHFLRQHYLRHRDWDLEDILGNDMNAAAIRGRYVNKGTIVGRRLNEEGKRQDYDKKIALTQYLEVRKTNRDKSNCLTTVEKDNVLTRLDPGRYEDAFARKEDWRYYSLTECCRLQTVPEDYFGDVVSESQAKKILGNGWTVDVAAHFFNGLKAPLTLSLDFTKKIV